MTHMARLRTKTQSAVPPVMLHLSAFLGGDSLTPRMLDEMLRYPEGLEFLIFVGRLRELLHRDRATGGDSWRRAVRAALRAAPRAARAPFRRDALTRQLTGASNRIGHALRISPRQRELLQCLLKGASTKEAAFQMGVTESTVHTWFKRLHRKLGVHSRGELLARLAPG